MYGNGTETSMRGFELRMALKPLILTTDIASLPFGFQKNYKVSNSKRQIIFYNSLKLMGGYDNFSS